MNRKKRLIFGVLIVAFIAFAGYKVHKMLVYDVFLHKFYKEKLWVHRTNSIEKLQEVSSSYKGIEVDIVFDSISGKFDVNHPPAESIGLSLYDYLKSNPSPELPFWLDFKNLTESNTKDALIRLNNICHELSLNKSNFIVEAHNTKALIHFKESGYRTSYYLHYPGLYTLPDDSLKIELNRIKEGLKYETTYISSPLHDYEIMKKYFPDKEKLLWFGGSELKYSTIAQKHLYYLIVAKDSKVKVLLLPVVTKAKNR